MLVRSGGFCRSAFHGSVPQSGGFSSGRTFRCDGELAAVLFAGTILALVLSDFPIPWHVNDAAGYRKQRAEEKAEASFGVSDPVGMEARAAGNERSALRAGQSERSRREWPA